MDAKGRAEFIIPIRWKITAKSLTLFAGADRGGIDS